MPTNPYDSTTPPVPYVDRKCISGRISTSDFTYFKTLFPFFTGLTDALVSTLVAHVISELRATGLTPAVDTAWNQSDPAYLALDRIVQRCVAGRPAGCTCSRHDPGTTCSICTALRSAPSISANPERRDGQGEQVDRSDADSLYEEACRRLAAQKQRRLGTTTP